MTVPWTVTPPVLQGGFHRIVSPQDLCVCVVNKIYVCAVNILLVMSFGMTKAISPCSFKLSAARSMIIIIIMEICKVPTLWLKAVLTLCISN